MQAFPANRPSHDCMEMHVSMFQINIVKGLKRTEHDGSDSDAEMHVSMFQINIVKGLKRTEHDGRDSDAEMHVSMF